jgi:hypothetical protein
MIFFSTLPDVDPEKKKGRLVSRILYPGMPGSLSFIWGNAHTLPLTTYPPGLGEPPSGPGLFGLSTHKVYPPQGSPPAAVSPYLTFSPLPAPPEAERRRLFSVALSRTPPRAEWLPVRKYAALCCPDFPHPGCPGSDKAACLFSKNVESFIVNTEMRFNCPGLFVAVKEYLGSSQPVTCIWRIVKFYAISLSQKT